MYLAFATQTTGLPHRNLPPEHPFQPHILQFAGICLDDTGVEIDRLVTLVRPIKVPLLPVGLKADSSISIDQARAQGVDAFEVFDWFTARCSGSEMIISHYLQLELEFIQILAARLNGEPWHFSSEPFCTMTRALWEVNLPPTPIMRAIGGNIPAPPSLSECFRYFFGEELPESLDAGARVQACIRVFRRLARNGT